MRLKLVELEQAPVTRKRMQYATVVGLGTTLLTFRGSLIGLARR